MLRMESANSIALHLEAINRLCERGEFQQCATVIMGLDVTVLKSLVDQLPIKAIITHIPASLCIMQPLFSRVLNAGLQFEHLYPERVLTQLVLWLSTAPSMDDTSYMSEIRTILHVINRHRPELCHRLWCRHKSLCRCVRDLGDHRPVVGTDGLFVHLHDALRSQLKTHLQQLRATSDRLSELGLVHEPVSLSGGPAPTRASHQRLLQVTSSEVQERLFINKSVLNAFESMSAHERLKQLLSVLEQRVAADKAALLLFAELRRETDGVPRGAALAPTLAKLVDGYSSLLKVLAEVTNDGQPISALLSGNGEFINTATEATEAFSDRVPLRRKASENVDISIVDRERPSSDPPSVPHSLPMHAHNGTSDLSHFPAASMPVVSAITTGPQDTELTHLRNEVTGLRRELTRCRETIARLNAREHALKDRLSAQAKKQFEKGQSKFEDLSLGSNRPTQLIRSYGDLYTEARLDAFDALDALPQLADFEDLKGKLLLSVVVLAFRSVQHECQSIRRKVRQLLQMPNPLATSTEDDGEDCVVDADAADVEEKISMYLRKNIDQRDMSRNLKEVSEQMWKTLYDYPSLKDCVGLQTYIEECVRLAWALTVQNPPLVVDYEPRVFCANMHTRFHSSDPDSDVIRNVLWPALREGENGPVVHKAVVIT